MIGDTLQSPYPQPHPFDGYWLPGWVSPTCPICTATSSVCTSFGGTCTTGGWSLIDVGTMSGGLNCGDLGLYSTVGTVPNKPFVWDLSRVGGQTGGWGGAIFASDAAMLDQKIDDGQPLSGGIIMISDNTGTSGTGSCAGTSARAPAINLPSTNCVNRATNSYITTYGSTCGDLMMPAPFE